MPPGRGESRTGWGKVATQPSGAGASVRRHAQKWTKTIVCRLGLESLGMRDEGFGCPSKFEGSSSALLELYF